MLSNPKKWLIVSIPPKLQSDLARSHSYHVRRRVRCIHCTLHYKGCKCAECVKLDAESVWFNRPSASILTILINSYCAILITCLLTSSTICSLAVATSLKSKLHWPVRMALLRYKMRYVGCVIQYKLLACLLLCLRYKMRYVGCVIQYIVLTCLLFGLRYKMW